MAGCTVGVMTEPDCLGPCEPGTGVLLEAVIWHESDTGMLVVNVSWKGRKYVGTLLDSSVHEWAPPSFRPDSPSRQQDNDAASPQKRKTRRGRGGRRNVQVVPSIPRTWGGDFKPHRSTLQDLANESRPEKRARCDIECPEQKCNKKFRCHNALEYHRIHAHVQNEIDASTPNKAKTSNKQTRGIQTQTCSEELQNKVATSSSANTVFCSSAQTVNTKQESKTTLVTSATVGNGQAVGNIAKMSDFSGTKDVLMSQSNQTGTLPAKPNSDFLNVTNTAALSGKSMQMFSTQKASPVSGTVRPMLNSKQEVKKGGAPVAVLRPLVPQHVAKLSADKTIASITLPTHTLSISSSQPQYRSVMPLKGVTTTVMTTSSALTKPIPAGLNVPGPVLPQSTASTSVMNKTIAQRNVTQNECAKSNLVTLGNLDGQKPRTPPSGSALAHRRDSGKSSHRGSRSNSMVSPNYSDISDASDGDMDTNQSEMPTKLNNGETDVNEIREVQSAEERLYCNEELPSPSNTPGAKDNEPVVSPIKTPSSRPNSRSNSAASSQAEASRQSVPLHAMPPPQHIMYPYFPFMPNSQLNSAPMSAGAPMYAPPPYFMTYQGFPVVPAQGHPGMPQQMAPGPAFVAVSGATTQVPQTKPN